ncbi:MAG: Flp family type IVb pilin [Azospirillum sp.]|nr:Flp family type IVb pilin [Azospirillum sp.]
MIKSIVNSHAVQVVVSEVLAAVSGVRKDRQGATAIEYGLIAAGVAVALIAGMAAFGPALQAFLEDLGSKLTL